MATAIVFVHVRELLPCLIFLGRKKMFKIHPRQFSQVLFLLSLVCFEKNHKSLKNIKVGS